MRKDEVITCPWCGGLRYDGGGRCLGCGGTGKVEVSHDAAAGAPEHGRSTPYFGKSGCRIMLFPRKEAP